MKIIKFFSLVALLVAMSACDPKMIIDEYKPIAARSWSYDNTPEFTIEVMDTSQRYNLYFNLRNTGNYGYNNLFVLFHIKAPDGKEDTKRLNFLLADNDGRWLGKGLGDLYDNQILVLKEMRFDKAGKYTFAIEQNMRDNPLVGITDVGLRIENQ